MLHKVDGAEHFGRDGTKHAVGTLLTVQAGEDNSAGTTESRMQS